MTVISSNTNADELTMELVAEFDAPPERVWQVWEDPRKLERWWGPPMAPATFERHELEPGGTVTYFMTSPEGERFYGVWLIGFLPICRQISMHQTPRKPCLRKPTPRVSTPTSASIPNRMRYATPAPC